MTGINTLTEIVDACQRKGSHEHALLPLVNAYFTGPDSFAAIEAWAAENGLRVLISTPRQTAYFYSAPVSR